MSLSDNWCTLNLNSARIWRRRPIRGREPHTDTHVEINNKSQSSIIRLRLIHCVWFELLGHPHVNQTLTPLTDEPAAVHWPSFLPSWGSPGHTPPFWSGSPFCKHRRAWRVSVKNTGGLLQLHVVEVDLVCSVTTITALLWHWQEKQVKEKRNLNSTVILLYVSWEYEGYFWMEITVYILRMVNDVNDTLPDCAQHRWSRPAGEGRRAARPRRLPRPDSQHWPPRWEHCHLRCRACHGRCSQSENRDMILIWLKLDLFSINSKEICFRWHGCVMKTTSFGSRRSKTFSLKVMRWLLVRN